MEKGPEMMSIREQGMENFKTTGIYALTAEDFSKGRTNLEVADALIQAGIRFLQYREKEKNAKDMYAECLAIRKATRAAGVTFIVNDHIDLALAVDADGVHVGQKDLPPAVVRRLIGPNMVLGLSTHCPAELEAAELSGVVDYVGVGPVYATQTKKDVCAAVGLAYVRHAAKGGLPFVAIGGIKRHNIADVVRAGAKTVAVVSEIVGAADIAAAAADLARAVKGA